MQQIEPEEQVNGNLPSGDLPNGNMPKVEDPYNTRWSKTKLKEIAKQARQKVEVKDRTYHLKTYSDCFIAREMTQWLLDSGHAAYRLQAIELGQALVENLHICHVVRDHNFKDDYLFFRFMVDEKDRGHV